ncbi:MAG: hypothetical protein PUF37_07215 [Prevotellaceae bacterium]|nr:hypothetical protein [Prevotellaceae bacterium]
MVTEREQREKDKLKKDKLSGFFLDMAKLSFAALVLGDIMPIINDTNSGSSILSLSLGIIMTIVYALLGYRILK